MVSDPLDVPLSDPELAAEIVLTVDLIIHANMSERRLTQIEIDALLGLHQDGPEHVPTRHLVGLTRQSSGLRTWRRCLQLRGPVPLARLRGAVLRSRRAERRSGR